MSKVVSLFGFITKKLLVSYLYSQYVEKSETIQKDVKQTFIVRGCKAKKNSVQKKFEHLMIYYPEYAFIFFWRTKLINKWFSRFFITQDYLCKIFGSTKIGGGLTCYHPYATVINAKSIGKNFQFRNGLTIGNKANDNQLIPTIGDNVTVGANVVIIGDIIIGDNVTVGAGAVVVKDVPNNSIVAGNPAKVIKTIT